MEAKQIHADGSEAEELRAWRVRVSAQWLREEIWQFLSPKENQFALRLVDELEKEALGRHKNQP